MSVDSEQSTYMIPWSERELAWQRLRPVEHRVPLPRPGQRVLVRLERFADPVPGVVQSVPDLARGWRWEDLEPGRETPDPWVWQLRRGPRGELLMDSHGLPRIDLLPDPHPSIVLHVEGRRGLAETREARLRGSPGWLPLDWRERWRPGPRTGWAGGDHSNIVGPQPRPIVVSGGRLA